MGFHLELLAHQPAICLNRTRTESQCCEIFQIVCKFKGSISQHFDILYGLLVLHSEHLIWMKWSQNFQPFKTIKHGCRAENDLSQHFLLKDNSSECAFVPTGLTPFSKLFWQLLIVAPCPYRPCLSICFPSLSIPSWADLQFCSRGKKKKAFLVSEQLFFTLCIDPSLSCNQQYFFINQPTCSSTHEGALNPFSCVNVHQMAGPYKNITAMQNKQANEQIVYAAWRFKEKRH